MLESNRKGWYGCFSLAGRNSAEKYHIIMHQKEIFSLDNPKKHTTNFFEPDKPKKDFSNENNLNLYKQYTGDPKLPKRNFFMEKLINSTTKHKQNFKIKLTPRDLSLSLSCRTNLQAMKKNECDSYDKYRYHHFTELRLKEHKEYSVDKKNIANKLHPNPDCYKFKRVKGIKWNHIKGRGESIFDKKEIDQKDFYLCHQPIKLVSSNFIDMNLQTQRGFFAGNCDVRLRSDKLYQPILSNNNNNINNNAAKDITEFGRITNNIEASKRIQKNISEQRYMINSASTSLIPFVNTPNFRKMISRDQANMKKQKKRRPEEDEHYIIKPNYAYIQPRAINMVLYDKNKEKNTKIKKSIRESAILNHNFFFNPTDTFNKTHRNLGAYPPDLSRMTSRPNNSGPLPSYMYKLYNRAAGNMTTDQTLKMNNYSEGHFMRNASFPLKKSFNLFINSNQTALNSKQRMRTYSSLLLLFKYCSNNNKPEVDGVTFKSHNRLDSIDLSLNKLSLP